MVTLFYQIYYWLYRWIGVTPFPVLKKARIVPSVRKYEQNRQPVENKKDMCLFN